MYLSQVTRLVASTTVTSGVTHASFTALIGLLVFGINFLENDFIFNFLSYIIKKSEL